MSKTERHTVNVAVFVILQNVADQVLLQRRCNTNYLDGHYDFSATGHMERGETIKQCAVREAKEEIGVDIAESDLTLVHINQNDIDVPYCNFTFMCKTWQGEPTICEPDKCDDLQFFALDNLPEKCTLNVRANEAEGFPTELSYSYVDPANYALLMDR